MNMCFSIKYKTICIWDSWEHKRLQTQKEVCFPFDKEDQQITLLGK